MVVDSREIIHLHRINRGRDSRIGVERDQPRSQGLVKSGLNLCWVGRYKTVSTRGLPCPILDQGLGEAEAATFESIRFVRSSVHHTCTFLRYTRYSGYRYPIVGIKT